MKNIHVSLKPVSGSLPPMVSFSHFMVSDLAIKFLIYFELVFVYVVQ